MELMPEPLFDRHGNEFPQPVPKMKLGGGDIFKILQPYLSTRFMDQARAVVPLALPRFVSIFGSSNARNGCNYHRWWLTRSNGWFDDVYGRVEVRFDALRRDHWQYLPRKLPLFGVLFIAFLLGVGVTFAEPAIGALQVAGSIVDPEKAPYLYTLLNDRSGTTVLLVGLGVGLAAVLGTVRFLRGWSLKPLIFLALPLLWCLA